jgi:hypothetical protein
MGKEMTRDRELHVGKVYLMSRLEALFENDRIAFGQAMTDVHREQKQCDGSYKTSIATITFPPPVLPTARRPAPMKIS